MAVLESPDVFELWYLEATSKAACAEREAKEKKAAVLRAVRETFGDNAAYALEATIRHGG